jgi:hypothetical protein
MRSILLFLLLCVGITTTAQQVLNKLGKTLKDQAGKAQIAAKAEAGEKGAQEKARLDSIDFQLVIIRQ